jgi:hypothetical protein
LKAAWKSWSASSASAPRRHEVEHSRPDTPRAAIRYGGFSFPEPVATVRITARPPFHDPPHHSSPFLAMHPHPRHPCSVPRFGTFPYHASALGTHPLSAPTCAHPLIPHPCRSGGAWLRLPCQELRTGSDKEGDHVIGRRECVGACDGCPEIRTVDVVLDRKFTMPAIA